MVTCGPAPTTSARRAMTRSRTFISIGMRRGRARRKRRNSRCRSPSSARSNGSSRSMGSRMACSTSWISSRPGIEGREYAKFVFSRSLSDALSLLRQTRRGPWTFRRGMHLSRFAAVRELYHVSGDVTARLRASVEEGKRRYELTRKLVLPPVLASPEQVFAFHLPPCQPNFITQKRVTAPTASLVDPTNELDGRILFVPSADPGYDWIFTRGISGFVTQFGGVNPHMAIRAGELGVPAVIGAGEAIFQRWRTARVICLDCANRQVQLVA